MLQIWGNLGFCFVVVSILHSCGVFMRHLHKRQTSRKLEGGGAEMYCRKIVYQYYAENDGDYSFEASIPPDACERCGV